MCRKRGSLTARDRLSPLKHQSQDCGFSDRRFRRQVAQGLAIRMPSPIAHAIAGAMAGWIVDRAAHRAADSGRLAPMPRSGMAADLDLLVGAHSGPTHGIGAAVIVWE